MLLCFSPQALFQAKNVHLIFVISLHIFLSYSSVFTIYGKCATGQATGNETRYPLT